MNKHILIHLSLIDGIGPGTIKKLVEHVSDMHLLYDMSIGDMRVMGLNEKLAGLIKEGLADKQLLHKELELIERNRIHITTIMDDDYPAILKHIHYPPVLLYYKGSPLVQFEKGIAVVGSRNGNKYAQDVVSAWIPELVHYQWTIISGGAIGVDTMAHREALRLQGQTVAVLGSGLLCPYPLSNKRMFEAIAAEGGALVSSFPLRMSALAGNFPARNRIISGMSKACLVVQAAKKSGASITAEYALEQGRMVFAVPGSIFDPLHEGCHALIKEGATIVGSSHELLVELGEIQPKAKVDSTRAKPSVLPASREELKEGASLQEQVIYHCSHNALSMDEIMVQIPVSLDELHEQLFNLQILGKIEQNASGLWQIC